MTFRKGTSIESKKTINILLANGGMGDQICALPAVDYLVHNCPWLNPLVWLPDYLVDYARHVIPGAQIGGYTDAKTQMDDTLHGVTTQWQGNHTPMRTHPVDYAFHQLVDKHEYNLNKKNYLQIRPNEIDISKFNLPKNYVVVAPLSVEKVKRLHPVVINQISDYLISHGYTPVYLGKQIVDTGRGVILSAESQSNFEKGINLLDQTSLLESAAIIAKAKFFVGMDGGLVHIAGSTQTAIVVGYTFINPEHNVPIRDGVLGKDVYTVVPDEKLECRFCQTNLPMLYGHDFRSCIFSDYQCVSQLTFEKFKDKIDLLIHLENL